MSRFVKEKIVAQYGAKFRDVSDAAVVSTQGVDVIRMTALRGALRARGIRAMVVHNRLGRRALEATGLAPVAPLLKGPSTLVWGGESIIDIAKALSAEAKNVVKMEVRGGVSAGQVLSKADLEDLARMPSREELIGQVVGRACGQAGRVASLVAAMGGRLAAQVREVEKKAPPDPAAAAPAEAAGAAAESPEAPAPEAPAGGPPA